jgi:uncharacterized membrane protein
MLVLTILCAIGSGLIAGSFYAFSAFVMRALAKLAARDGVAAMQSINNVVINPAFLSVFVGTAIACGIVIVCALFRWESARSIELISGAVLYIAGTFGVTMFGNVPLNNSLARLNPDDENAPKLWRDYVRRWTMWNHVRTAAALVTMVLFVITR